MTAIKVKQAHIFGVISITWNNLIEFHQQKHFKKED